MSRQPRGLLSAPLELTEQPSRAATTPARKSFCETHISTCSPYFNLQLARVFRNSWRAWHGMWSMPADHTCPVCNFSVRKRTHCDAIPLPGRLFAADEGAAHRPTIKILQPGKLFLLLYGKVRSSYESTRRPQLRRFNNKMLAGNNTGTCCYFSRGTKI